MLSDVPLALQIVCENAVRCMPHRSQEGQVVRDLQKDAEAQAEAGLPHHRGRAACRRFAADGFHQHPGGA